MKTLIRIVATFLVIVFVFYFVFWVGGALIQGLARDHLPDPVVLIVSYVIAAATAAVAARYIWRQPNSPDGLVKDMIVGGLLVGGFGFCGGFFGPVLFAPEANQGPLLGLFIMGPLGLVLGIVGGAVYWILKKRRVPKSPQ